MRTNEAIERLDAAVNALRDVDVSVWSDEVLLSHLGQLSAALCQVDAALSRVADAVRDRGYGVDESAGFAR